MFFAEEPEPRSFRPVLAIRVVAVHVEFAAAELPWNSISSTAASSRSSKKRGDTLREDLSEPVDQRIEWMRRPSGHDLSYDRYEPMTQLRRGRDVIGWRIVMLIHHGPAWRIRGATLPREATRDEQDETDEGA